MRPLRATYFPGADAWGLYAGLDRGFFAGVELDVQATPATGSVAQMTQLMNGEFDVALTAMDNLVAYNEGQGDPSVPGPCDLVAFMAMNQGLMYLVARPEIASPEALRGKRLAVDAVATGYSFVLRYMLETYGIADGDYDYVPVGNTERRLQALAEDRADAALVQAPFELVGRECYGLQVMRRAIDVLGHYQATVWIARRSWAASNRELLAAFAGAYREATGWIHANRAEAIAILARDTKMPAELASQAAPLVLDPVTGLRPDCGFETAGIETVLRLRSRFAAPKNELGPVSRYIDERLAS